MAEKSAADIAAEVGGSLVGDGSVKVSAVASLADAGERHVSFLGNEKYRAQVATTEAGIVLVPIDYAAEPPPGRAYIRCDNPNRAFSQLVVDFAPAPLVPTPGTHPAAVVAEGATVAPSASIGACAVIEEGAVIGEKTIIGAGTYIGHGARIGRDCHLYPNVTVREACILGDRVIVHSGTVIGSDGFGFEMSKEGHTKIPQIGMVQIDDDVELGACVTVDRARFGRTWIKRGVKVDNLVQIAHNVVIGEHSVIVAQVGISGSAILGKHVIMAGQSGAPGHIHIGDGATIMGKSGPMSDVEPGATLMGMPAMPRAKFMRCSVLYQRLPDMHSQLKSLQKQVEELSRRLAELDPS